MFAQDPWSFPISVFPFAYEGKGFRVDTHKLGEATSAPRVPFLWK